MVIRVERRERHTRVFPRMETKSMGSGLGMRLTVTEGEEEDEESQVPLERVLHWGRGFRLMEEERMRGKLKKRENSTFQWYVMRGLGG